ncbi:hypothetical protein [Haloarcula sp. Atlit-7R]|uniref:hypothetical protein n=1 Tax=Haloarcula sp. Atlit-7R TaxID=2282125 RepID=UPI000EF156BA|nr:hypothetical protein [Haloarcula sp. Atlit-7R]RLM94302.1 hypothetical protein D3D01_15680 [Haloarcula sp. Atlit-7R]
MGRRLEKGNRERLSLEQTEFKPFEFEQGSSTHHLHAHKNIRPVGLQDILGVLDNLYGRDRQEFLGKPLDHDESAVLTLFEPEGVWAFEDYDKMKVTVQIKEGHRDEFLKRVDSRFDGDTYPKLGIDPQDVIETAQDHLTASD